MYALNPDEIAKVSPSRLSLWILVAKECLPDRIDAEPEDREVDLPCLARHAWIGEAENKREKRLLKNDNFGIFISNPVWTNERKAWCIIETIKILSKIK